MKLRTFALAGLAAGALTVAFRTPAAVQPSLQEEGAAAGPVTYAIDAGHSCVLFRIQHLGVSYFHGRFNEIEGSLTVDAENPSRSSVVLEIPTASVDTNSEKRDEHLRSADFFDSEEHPAILFESKSVEKSGDTWRVTGDLTLHGVTKEVEVDLEHVGTATTRMGPRTGFEGTFTIDRTDFGVGSYPPDVLGNEVRITISVEGIQR